MYLDAIKLFGIINKYKKRVLSYPVQMKSLYTNQYEPIEQQVAILSQSDINEAWPQGSHCQQTHVTQAPMQMNMAAFINIIVVFTHHNAGPKY